jgi:nucleoside-diphosphate-sugar epimerase
MSSCIIFGGSGFVGTHLTKRLLATGRFDKVIIADIKNSLLESIPGVTFQQVDVRETIPSSLAEHGSVEWIFNLAAVHREPGHIANEYFSTNLRGAEHVTQFAREIQCRNIYFTSSISVYGPTETATTEQSPICPITPYGGSKYPAELIHRGWVKEEKNRRLIISRPGVLYGAGDPGNILRMIRAVRKGYFAVPGSLEIVKAFGYIEGLLDSIEFTMADTDREIIYNYAEDPSETLGEIIQSVKQFFGVKATTPSIPISLLLPAAHLIQAIAGARNPIHPVRVKKAATPTHIVPAELLKRGFPFQYSFEKSLAHWSQVAPEDFGITLKTTTKATLPPRLTLKRGSEQADDAVAMTNPIEQDILEETHA